MSADVLREAARLMRERAELTDSGRPVPRWYVPEAVGLDGLKKTDRIYIASWHPAVALAVADWLEAVSEFNPSPTSPALTVARAYLGTQPISATKETPA